MLAGILAVSGLFVSPTPAMAGNPSAEIGNYLAGRHAQNIQDPRAAIELYRAALKSDPGNLDIRIRIFSILVSEGQIQEALPIAETLAKLETRRVGLATLLLALREVRQKNYDGAIDQPNSLPDDGINAFTLPLLRAWVLAGQKKYAEAVAVLKTQMSNPGVVALFGPHATLILERSGDVEAAETQCQGALKNFRRVGFDITRVAGAFYERIGKPDKARKLYENLDFPQKRVQKFVPANGKPSINKVVQRLDSFLKECFTPEGEYNIEHTYSKEASKKNCKWCDFNQTDLCDAGVK